VTGASWGLALVEVGLRGVHGGEVVEYNVFHAPLLLVYTVTVRCLSAARMG
jgi:hypothetical protein